MTKCVTYLEFTWSQSITNNVYDYKPQLFLDNYCYCLKWPNTLISYYQALVTNTQGRQAIIKVNNSEKMQMSCLQFDIKGFCVLKCNLLYN